MTRTDSHNRSSTSSTSSCSRSGRSYYTAATSTASARQRPVALLLFLVTLGSCFLCAMFAKPLELSDFSVQDGDGKDFAMDQFKDVPAVLIVNVASKCGYTDSNYRELQTLRTRHSEDKLTIIAFPCNQFGGQEPAPWSEIADFVQREYGASFPVMGKVNVNGHQSHPIFAWLKAASGIPGDIPWNFSKFLVTCGDRVQRYSHEVSPMQIEEDIINAPDICSGDLFIGEL